MLVAICKRCRVVMIPSRNYVPTTECKVLEVGYCRECWVTRLLRIDRTDNREIVKTLEFALNNGHKPSDLLWGDMSRHMHKLMEKYRRKHSEPAADYKQVNWRRLVELWDLPLGKA